MCIDEKVVLILMLGINRAYKRIKKYKFFFLETKLLLKLNFMKIL